MKLLSKKKYFLVVALIVITDQVSKLIVQAKLHLYEPVSVFKGFFQLIYVTNKGAIWGLFSDGRSALPSLIITGLSVIALIMVILYFLKIDNPQKWELSALSLILGGALGNVIDRIFRGYVVDFLDFYIRSWHWPTFNVADSCITVGVIWLGISFFFVKKPDPLSQRESNSASSII